MELHDKLRTYYVTAILGVVFAIVGFSYNAWRLEVSEDNNNIRTASFEVLKELAELEQIIYAAHFDRNEIEGSPRKGWVKIGLIVDLSSLVSKPVEKDANALASTWQDNWENITQDRSAVDQLVNKIETVRQEIKSTLGALE